MSAKPIRQFVYFAILAIACTSLGVSSARAQTLVQGTVTDRNTGLPLSGVVVSIANVVGMYSVCNGNSLSLTTTDANGGYSLTGLQLNNQAQGYLCFELKGYYFNVEPYNISSGAVTVNASLLTGGTVLQGTVTDASTQAAVAGASIMSSAFTNQNENVYLTNFSVTSDNMGHYVLDSSLLPEGASTGFWIGGLAPNGSNATTVSATGYLTLNPTASAVSVPFPATLNFSLVASTSTAVQGTVTDRNTGLPLSGVVVSIANVVGVYSVCNGNSLSLTTTDANGGYSLTGLQLNNQAQGYLCFELKGYYFNVEPYNISSGAVTVNASLLTGGTVLQGTVTDASTQAAVAGASIMSSAFTNQNENVYLTNFSVTSDNMGHYVLDSSLLPEGASTGFWIGGLAPNGSNATTVSATGYLTLNPTASAVSVPFPATLNFSLVASTSTAVQGTVTDRNTGLPLSGVVVSIANVVGVYSVCNGNSLSLTTTDANGGYSLTGLQLNNQAQGYLCFELKGYYFNVEPYNISSGAVTVNASLLTGGTVLQGTVTDASTQAAVAGASIMSSAFTNQNENVYLTNFSVTSDNMGHYVLDSSLLPEGASTGFWIGGLAPNGSNATTVSATGYLTLNPTASAVSLPFPDVQNFRLISDGVSYSITIATVPTGSPVVVDGQNYVSPQTFTWHPSNPHSIAVPATIAGSVGVQEAFTSWSDGGTLAHTIVVPGYDATYTATFITQNMLTTAANPSAGGTITAGGWFNAGSSIQISAMPNSGYQFTGFSGSLTGPTNPQTILLNAPSTVTANFTKVLSPTTTTLTSSSNPSVFGQTLSLSATVNATTTPTGSVTFYDGSTALSTLPLTGSQAMFSTPSLSVGTHILTATYSGDGTYATSTSATLYQDVVVLQSGTLIYGVVTDRTTGAPIPGVWVASCTRDTSCANTTTDASGSYSLTGSQISGTSGALYFQGQGYYGLISGYNLGTPPLALNVTLLPGGPIMSGSVTDSTTQAALGGASLSLTDYGGQLLKTYPILTIQANANGNYEFDSADFNETAANGFGANSLIVSASGYLTSVNGFGVAPPYPVTQNFSLLPNSGTAIQGTVTNRNTGAPIPGVWVATCTRDTGCASATTDASGSYTLTANDIGSSGGTLYFQGQGYYGLSSNYSLGTPPLTLNVTLLPGGPIMSGSVTDSTTQAAVGGASLSLTDYGGQLLKTYPILTIQANANGNYEFDSADFNETAANGFGANSLIVSASGYLTSVNGFGVAPPYPVTQNFSLLPNSGTAIQGTVTNRNTGAPIPGVWVATCTRDTGCASATTDASGSYTLTANDIGSSGGTLYFQGQGYYGLSSNYSLGTPPLTLNVTLLPGGPIMSGSVTDSTTQAAVGGASLSLTDYGGQLLKTYPVLTILAAANGNYAFDSADFNETAANGFGANSLVVSAPGYLTSPNGFGVALPYPVTQNFALLPNGPSYPVTVTTTPVGMSFSVDGSNYTTAQTFSWPANSVHLLGTASPQGNTGTHYLFNQWNDGGAQSHQITIAGASTYTASFVTQYLLTTSTNPSNEGTVSPASGTYYNSGTVVNLSATANSGYGFTSWSGNVANANSASTSVTMSAPQSVTANFAPTTHAPAITSASSTTFTMSLGNSFLVMATGTPTPSISEAGALPSGVTFNTGTNMLTGTPAAGTAGTYHISFTASNVIGTNAVQSFTLTVVNLPAPTLASVTPNSGLRGTVVPVTLIGTSFTSTGTTVTVSGAGVTVGAITVVNATTITTTFTITNTAGLTARNITVKTSAGTSNPQTFTVVGAALTSISPNSGARGTSLPVTLIGSGLTGSTAITGAGGGITISGLTVVSDTTITATFTIAPNAALTARTVGVTTPIGATNAVTFTVVDPSVPTLASVAPNVGLRGTTVPVTLMGTNFTATGTTVGISGTGVTVGTITVVNSTTITTTLTISNTAAIGGRDLTVTTPGGTSSNQIFTILGPALTLITPQTGARGTSVPVILSGSGLTGTTAINVSGGGVTVSGLTIMSDASVTATFTIAPTAGLTARTVSVTTAPGGTSNTVTFTIVAPPLPTLTSVAPNTGVRGTTVPVTLMGGNFTSTGTTVAVSGSGVTVGPITIVNSGEITTTFTITATAALTARNITVSNPGGNSGTQTFTVLGPTLVSVAPNPATHGTGVSLTLTGSNLGGATTVTVSGTGSTCTAGSSTSTTVGATCTLTAGTKTIKVTTPIGTTGTISLVVN